MSEKKKISKWATLYRFPGNLWTKNNCYITTRIGATVERDIPYLKRDFANLINRELNYNNYYDYKLNEKRILREKEKIEGSSVSDDVLLVNLDINLDDIDVDDDDYEVSSDELEKVKFKLKNLVFDKQVVLKQITKDTHLYYKIKPILVRCGRCGYIMLISDNYAGSLLCPECKKIMMKQVPLIYVCTHCGKISELVPKWVNQNTHLDKPIPCPNKRCSGHLQLFIDMDNMGNSFYRCSECNLDFSRGERIDERTGRRYSNENLKKVWKICDCGFFDVSQKEGASEEEEKRNKFEFTYFFKPVPSTSKIYETLINSCLYINEIPISHNVLKENSERFERENPIEFFSLEKLSDINKNIINSLFCIKDFFFIDKINSYTGLYGYRASVSPMIPKRITDPFIPEKLVNLFPDDSGRYIVYLLESIGKGLYIKLDEDEILKRLISLEEIKYDLSYNDIRDNLIKELTESPIQDLNRKKDQIEFKFLSIIHSIEHAFNKSINLELGLDAIDSVIVLDNCGILLYEYKKVLSGGLTQLALGSEDKLVFMQVLSKIEEGLKRCVNSCKDACIACNFLDDFKCRPYLNNEINRWVPPNLFLNRRLAKKTFLKK